MVTRKCVIIIYDSQSIVGQHCPGVWYIREDSGSSLGRSPCRVLGYRVELDSLTEVGVAGLLRREQVRSAN